MSDPMTYKSGRREALDGAERLTLDLIFEVLTQEQWAEMLRAPLELAAAKGNRDLAQRLVRAGAEIGGALHEAVKRGRGEIANDLLESGASLAAKDTRGRTPLHTAALRGQTEMVQLLLLKGADIDTFDNDLCSPLCLAAFQGCVAAVLTLLAAGADVDLPCGPFKAPVMLAAALKGNCEMLRAFIQHGADVDAVDLNTDQHYTALHLAARHNKAEAIDVLVEAGADIEAQDYHGRTPLHYASLELSGEALLCLVKHGATVDTEDVLFITPLMLAAAQAGTEGAAEVVDSLLRAGADETIVESYRSFVADVIGADAAEEQRLAEDVERVRKLLANAPADRAWRRRGYLVLCRAYPDRVQHSQVMISGTNHANTPHSTSSRARLARAGGVAGDITVHEGTCSNWAVAVSKVLLLQEDGIFRTIVGHL